MAARESLFARRSVPPSPNGAAADQHDIARNDLDRTLAALATRFAVDAAEHDAQARVPAENFRVLHDHGLLGLTVPSEHGGGGAGLTTAMSAIGQLARGEPSTALILSMQYLFLQRAAYADRWPAHLRKRVFRDAVEKGALGNGLRVEPGLGTPLRGGLPETTARQTAEGWSISGHKIYATGIPVLTWLGVWARTDEPEPRVGTFLVPADRPGIRVVESWNHLGMRASGSHDVLFDNVVVPPDYAVDVRTPAEWGSSVDPVSLLWSVVLVSALYDGIARNARDWVIGFLKTRTPTGLGAPLATLPRMQEAVGTMEAELWASRHLLDTAAASFDRGNPLVPAEAGLLKLLVTRSAIKVVETAMEISGNPGLSRANPLERHHRDVLCSRIHTPQNDSIFLSAGRRALAG